MFGREYANHLNILMESFTQMNDEYKKSNKKKNTNSPLNSIRKWYISFLGIPEIGFQVRGIHFKKIISRIKTQNPQRILDAGSGIGAYTFRLSQYFKRAAITGVDIDKSKINSAKKIKKELKLNNVNFLYSDISKLSSKEKYDLVVIIDVLEHIENYEKVLKKLYSLLKKGAYLYIHVPQPNQKRIFKIMEKWHHEDHVVEGITKTDLQKALKKLGFKIIECKETFGFFGKLAWELNHLMLSKNLATAGITYPLLYPLIYIDTWSKNKNGLCVACLAQKNK